MLKTIALLTLLSSPIAFAAVESPRVDQRQTNQTVRIVEGVRSGELTGVETAALVRQQARTRSLERRLEADGRLSVIDRVRLKRRQDRTSRSIAVRKHDRR